MSGACDWLIVGLGNPGREHADTRHNVGFMVADALAERWELGRPRERYRGRIAEGRAGGIQGGGYPAPGESGSETIGPPVRPRVALLWPQTYMNEAGRSVGPARGALQVPLDRVVVVHDEIDIPFGEIRARLGGGLAGHNGLRSLARELGGPDFVRVRVGVGRPASSDPEIVSSYVLARFREDPAQVRELVERAADTTQRIVLGAAPEEAARVSAREEPM
ncbi:MAG TPA: aminoacyl-tRNA hydrolase [Solirubrobacteraceae bacterium]|jgi:PTH1 family peptidyl-tRNA hydrolase|nr:aminoacyl-tRNA hydrolase [Solirubrobacteraceae bacterium]